MKPYNRKKATLPTEIGIDSVLDVVTPVEEPTINDLTLYEKLPEWLQNFRTNLDTIGFNYTITDLPRLDGQSALVVEKPMSSTSFFNQVEYLKEYDGTIIVCDRALYKVLEYGVIPEYVCQLDSSWLCWSFFDRPDVKKHMDKITAIFSTTTHPLTIRLWHGKRVFFQPYMGSADLTSALMRIGKVPYMETGGQVATFCWLLAAVLGANPIGIFGITNSFDKLSESEYPNVKHRKVKTPYGTVYQDPVFQMYAESHLKIIEAAYEKRGIVTINCTKTGCMYGKGIKDWTLKQFIDSQQKVK